MDPTAPGGAPATTTPTGGPPMDPLAAIGGGWNAFTFRPWVSLGVLLVLLAIQIASELIPFVNLLACVLVTPALYAGGAWFFLRGVRKEDPPFETAFEGFQRWPSATGAVLILGLGALVAVLPVILVTVGMAGLGALLSSGGRGLSDLGGAAAAASVFVAMVFCFPIALWWWSRAGFTVFTVMEPDRPSALEAVKRSFALSRGSTWRIIGLGLLWIPIGMLGTLALCVGIVPAMAVMYYGVAHGYEQLRRRAGLPSPLSA